MSFHTPKEEFDSAQNTEILKLAVDVDRQDKDCVQHAKNYESGEYHSFLHLPKSILTLFSNHTNYFT